MTLQAFGRSIDVFVQSLSPAATAAVARQATRVLNETLRASRPAPSYRFNIGGKFFDRQAVPVDQLAGGAEIIILFDHRKEVAQRALTLLRSLSPVGSGDFVGEFTLFVDGRESALSAIRAGRSVEITNTAPYARRLEVGRSADGSPFIVKGPYGLMERGGAKVIRRDFNRLANVSFGYRDIDSPYIIKGRHVGTKYISSYGLERTRQALKDRDAGQPVRYPTVIIGEREYEF